jgi:hypothetical protein
LGFLAVQQGKGKGCPLRALVAAIVYLTKQLGREFAGHSTVNHRAKQYSAKGSFGHTNTVEYFFSIFKCSVIGTFHHLSEAQFNRYWVEFDLRNYTRDPKDSQRRDEALKGIEAKRFTCRRTNQTAH